jgi:hypothetical protein
MVGEILGKRCVFVLILMAVSVTLEHDTPYFSFESGLGNPFVSRSTCYKVISWVSAAKSLVVSFICSREVHTSPLLSRPSAVVHSYYVGLPYVHFNSYSYFVSHSKSVTYFVSWMGDTSRPSCDESYSVKSNSLSGNET